MKLLIQSAMFFGTLMAAALVALGELACCVGQPLGSEVAQNQLERTSGRYALCTMCIGVGQGIAVILERV